MCSSIFVGDVEVKESSADDYSTGKISLKVLTDRVSEIHAQIEDGDLSNVEEYSRLVQFRKGFKLKYMITKDNYDQKVANLKTHTETLDEYEVMLDKYDGMKYLIGIKDILVFTRKTIEELDPNDPDMFLERGLETDMGRVKLMMSSLILLLDECKDILDREEVRVSEERRSTSEAKKVKEAELKRIAEERENLDLDKAPDLSKINDPLLLEYLRFSNRMSLSTKGTIRLQNVLIHSGTESDLVAEGYDVASLGAIELRNEYLMEKKKLESVQ